MANACDSDDLPQRNARQRRRPEAMDLEVPLKSVHQHFDAPDHGASHVKMGSYKATTTAEEEDVQSGSHQQQYRADAEDGQNFEYLDHTADIQIHSWGERLEDAFANAGLAMFNYMTPLTGVDIIEEQTREFEAEGRDLDSLLFAFLDELLFVFHTEMLVCKEIQVTALDRESWTIKAVGRGERFERERHASGTEIKAITYSNMQIKETEGDAEVFVIVDI